MNNLAKNRLAKGRSADSARAEGPLTGSELTGSEPIHFPYLPSRLTATGILRGGMQAFTSHAW